VRIRIDDHPAELFAGHLHFRLLTTSPAGTAAHLEIRDRVVRTEPPLVPDEQYPQRGELTYTGYDPWGGPARSTYTAGINYVSNGGAAGLAWVEWIPRGYYGEYILDQAGALRNVLLHCATERGTKRAVVEVTADDMGYSERFACPPTEDGEPRYLYRIGFQNTTGQGAPFSVRNRMSKMRIRILMADGKTVVLDDYTWVGETYGGDAVGDFYVPLGAAAGRSFYLDLEWYSTDNRPIILGTTEFDVLAVQLDYPVNYVPPDPTPPPLRFDVVGVGSGGRARFT
jgi:hypothetical protein